MTRGNNSINTENKSGGGEEYLYMRGMEGSAKGAGAVGKECPADGFFPDSCYSLTAVFSAPVAMGTAVLLVTTAGCLRDRSKFVKNSHMQGTICPDVVLTYSSLH